MRLSSVICVLTAALANGLPVLNARAELPPYFVLTGDSTTATGGGWGDGFLSYRQNSAGGINHAKNGATTVSFKADGYWAKAIQSVKDNKSKYRPIVTIQFGHNDQKPEKGISLSQFQANLEQLAREVISAGGTPVGLFTSTPCILNH
jgi:lysophospholipase L1-like esterase